MARLLSVNVGLPRDIRWRDKTVHTAIWKMPVAGRCRTRRLNLDGDGQGDLAGHGGEQRAVLVYQIESYRYWQQRLGRDDFVMGQFGENFTVEGLADDEVCIGDRFRIGSALFEVTQPRTTCYRVGIRMAVPQMAALLTATGRPGFYLCVIEEGAVAAGDAITYVVKGPERITVAVANSLLYSKSHPRDLLERSLRIPALSPGWRGSFEALLKSNDANPDGVGNAGLMPAPSGHSPRPGFRALEVVRKQSESVDVVSFVLEPKDGQPLMLPAPGQFIVLCMRVNADGPALFRSYSLSGLPSEQRYRISVKVEPHGVVGTYLRQDVHVGDVVDVSDPRGNFTLQPRDGAVVLLSAGIGATPVLAMLQALVASKSSRPVWWLHGARDGATRSFAAETRELLGTLIQARSRVWYSAPGVNDREGVDYDAKGRMNVMALAELGVPRDADFYLCGPPPFLAELRAGLATWGVDGARIHSEVFAGGPGLMPGVVAGPMRLPHQPPGEAGTGPLVSFARSGIAVRWRRPDETLLELAEACDVPVRWSCRSGVCHNCEIGLISGHVSYEPEPLDRPAPGIILTCCSRPVDDVVIDL